MQAVRVNLVKIHDFLWEIPRQGAMLVPGRLYLSASMLEDLRDDPALIQVANVACLPGIVGYSLAMPDVHWGYGFPIGGVAATDARTGVISPGGVGYDINCGVRLARTNLHYEDIASKIDRLADALFSSIPAGVGSEGAIPSLSVEELRHVVREGAEWRYAMVTHPRKTSITRKKEAACRWLNRRRSASKPISAAALSLEP